MGACLEPTPTMDPYRIEIRRESFYLNRSDATADTVSTPGRYELTVPIKDATPILAALDQAVAHPQWACWPRPDTSEPSDTAWTLPPDGAGPAADPAWTVTRDGTSLRIRGPWVVHYDTNWRQVGTEICYRDLEALRDAITT